MHVTWHVCIYMCVLVCCVFMSHSLYVYLQLGKLAAPMDIEVAYSGSSITISWMAPFSLQLSTPPSIFNYILNNNVTNSVTTISPAKCEPSMHCNYSLDLREKAMLDYNGTVEFTLFAVNGAGNGSAATYTSELQRKAMTTNYGKLHYTSVLIWNWMFIRVSCCATF